MTEGWIETQIAESARRGNCPVCDALSAGRDSYLTWIRTNLNDEKFRREAISSGGYCLPDLHAVVESLQTDPYNRLNLLKVMRSVMLMVANGKTISGCHLCSSQRDTARAYAVVINSSLIQGGRKPPAFLCNTHTPLLSQRTKEQDGSSPAINVSAGSRQAQFPDAITAFTDTVEAILKDFHLKAPEALGREVERCEALMFEAMTAEKQA